jgi:hypothetical protein
MSEPLSVAAILDGMADALPTHPTNDSSSDLASSYEVIALLIHSYLAALGFKLLGFDEDKNIRKFTIQYHHDLAHMEQPNASLSLLVYHHNGIRVSVLTVLSTNTSNQP